MANDYSFTVNTKMLVDTWDERTAELTGEIASVTRGKYYDVFPPLFSGTKTR
jgi:hypothetical protein